MAKEPGDRFPSAGDLARAATAAVEGQRGRATAERSVATGKAAPMTRPRPIAAPEPADTDAERAAPGGPPPTEPTEPPTEPARRAAAASVGDGPSRGVLLGGLAALAALVVAAVAAARRRGRRGLAEWRGDVDAGDHDRQGWGRWLPRTVQADVRRPDPGRWLTVGLAIHDHDVSVATRRAGSCVTFDEEERKQARGAVDLGGQGEDVATVGGFAWVIDAAGRRRRGSTSTDGGSRSDGRCRRRAAWDRASSGRDLGG